MAFKRSRLFRLLAICALPAVMVLCLATASPPTDKPQIKFAPGADSASLKGEIQGMDRDVYPITAKAGQTMQVKVSNKQNLVLFRIQKPGAGACSRATGRDALRAAPSGRQALTPYRLFDSRCHLHPGSLMA
ncbi:hypothetical protein DesfrDRAFT_1005 [Solidesulfovibrio fructosivorans JJ]]|uniref:Uncharacterized protein n=1 Tax=Solidesulfovibrio fructosivorans JJ] TaxID=596151 RepID=E1JTQ6_SOLFR|nr:hypothetical protein [Solidesulfovibrio fructosivorans]EFL52185.1 hypothetical protein DesfrDRAFT_1005 [Solidesulfovibrio fructosivorans JJ]]